MKKAGEITYTTVNRSKTGEGYEEDHKKCIKY